MFPTFVYVLIGFEVILLIFQLCVENYFEEDSKLREHFSFRAYLKEKVENYLLEEFKLEKEYYFISRPKKINHNKYVYNIRNNSGKSFNIFIEYLNEENYKISIKK